MIWVDGHIVPDEGLTIRVTDRTFEHGLGLFETMRTWHGEALLLDRHLARLKASAHELGLPLEPASLPDRMSVARLVKASAIEGDAIVRLTLTGGHSESGGSVLWMRASPLPSPLLMGGRGAVVDLGWWRVDRDDALLRHKSLNYWSRRVAYQKARERGFDEVLSQSDGPLYWEGSRTNLFLVVGTTLVTPALDGPIVPGIMRGLVLELARSLSMETVEVRNLGPQTWHEASEVFLTNSVRGLLPVAQVGAFSWEAPGKRTQSLSQLVRESLDQGVKT